MHLSVAGDTVAPANDCQNDVSATSAWLYLIFRTLLTMGWQLI